MGDYTCHSFTAVVKFLMSENQTDLDCTYMWIALNLFPSYVKQMTFVVELELYTFELHTEL